MPWSVLRAEERCSGGLMPGIGIPSSACSMAHASFFLLYLRSITQMEPGGMQEDMKECPVHGDRVKVERPDNYETAQALQHKGAAHEAAETEVTHEKQASIADLESPYRLSSCCADSILPLVSRDAVPRLRTARWRRSPSR